MATRSISIEDVLQALEGLSPEGLAAVRQFAEFLRFQTQGQPQPRRVVRLGGLWKDLPAITEADIAAKRRRFANSARSSVTR